MQQQTELWETDGCADGVLLEVKWPWSNWLEGRMSYIWSLILKPAASERTIWSTTLTFLVRQASAIDYSNAEQQQQQQEYRDCSTMTWSPPHVTFSLLHQPLWTFCRLSTCNWRWSNLRDSVLKFDLWSPVPSKDGRDNLVRTLAKCSWHYAFTVGGPISLTFSATQKINRINLCLQPDVH